MNRDKFRQELEDELGDAFAVSYFDRSEFTEGAHPVLRPWSYVADQRLRERAKDVLKRCGVKLGPVEAEHLKAKSRRRV